MIKEKKQTVKDDAIDTSRRGFFTRLAPKAEPLLPHSEHARPPWAVDNDLFLALCASCDQCIEECPQRIIAKSEERDPLLAGKPVLDMSYGSCDFCGDCVKACPTAALSIEHGTKRQVLPKLVGHCQATLGMYCHLCQEACPEQAISFERNDLIIAMDTCTGCGECAFECPSSVLAMQKV